jgi:hypothetical protein
LHLSKSRIELKTPIHKEQKIGQSKAPIADEYESAHD